MASGLNGQRFCFHGYLPIDQRELSLSLRALERQSRETGATQIFIESPHRNQRLLAALLRELAPSTTVCLALDLTGGEERIISKPVSEWTPVNLPKLPCIFLFQA
jgi:16S rRNA (cytidine1402-2'-O)-methyltransferase